MPPDRLSPLGELRATVTGLFVGRARQRWEGRPPSAIGKRAAEGVLNLGPTGFDRDEQADLTVHGGVDKAVHHDAADHHSFWRDAVPKLADRIAPGCFGENVSTCGIVESDPCIGDVLKLGTATVQVSQGRQPCWKLNAHPDIPERSWFFTPSARSGQNGDCNSSTRHCSTSLPSRARKMSTPLIDTSRPDAGTPSGAMVGRSSSLNPSSLNPSASIAP